MPAATILIVSAIVAVFALFGIVLAWGDRQTRGLPRSQAAGTDVDRGDQLKKAA
jgi:hypothetical protein